MASITQDLRFKQAVIEYSLAHGVTKAAVRYRKTRQWIYYWRRRLRPLGWKSPNQYLADYFNSKSVTDV